MIKEIRNKTCSNCIMDTTAPILFDVNGVCNYCHDWREREFCRKIAKQELPWIIHKMKKDKGQYDCLLGLSGGVDSSMCLHLLVEQGIKPLCFSVDNGHNSPLADENIMRMVETLKVPFIRKVIDLEEFKDLQRSFEKSNTLNIEIPTDHILMAMTYKMAKEHKIKWIVGGGNHATEGIMPQAWGYNARDLTFLKAVHGKPIKKLPTISLLQYIWYRFINKIKMVNLLDYYEYDRNKAIQILSDKYGYKPYGDKHGESKYTKWFQDIYLPRYGIIKEKAHLSSMINSKQITRDEALVLIKDIELGNEKPTPFFRFRNSKHHWDLLSKIYAKIKAWK